MLERRIAQGQVDVLKEKYAKKLNKNNIRLKFQNDTIIIKSSILRLKLGIDILILYSLIRAILRPNNDTYFFPVILFLIYFLYSIWEDTESINNIKIDVHNRTLRIYHTNLLRALLLKIFLGYQSKYSFPEIKRFDLHEKFHMRVVYRKNYIVIQLTDDDKYILLDIPDKPQARILTDLLNEIVKFK